MPSEHREYTIVTVLSDESYKMYTHLIEELLFRYAEYLKSNNAWILTVAPAKWTKLSRRFWMRQNWICSTWYTHILHPFFCMSQYYYYYHFKHNINTETKRLDIHIIKQQNETKWNETERKLETKCLVRYFTSSLYLASLLSRTKNVQWFFFQIPSIFWYTFRIIYLSGIRKIMIADIPELLFSLISVSNFPDRPGER